MPSASRLMSLYWRNCCTLRMYRLLLPFRASEFHGLSPHQISNDVIRFCQWRHDVYRDAIITESAAFWCVVARLFSFKTHTKDFTGRWEISPLLIVWDRSLDLDRANRLIEDRRVIIATELTAWLQEDRYRRRAKRDLQPPVSQQERECFVRVFVCAMAVTCNVDNVRPSP